MNERIRELAKQADIYSDKHAESRDYVVLRDQYFAELIVRECAGIYDKIDNGNSHMGTDDYLEALHRTFFGVKE